MKLAASPHRRTYGQRQDDERLTGEAQHDECKLIDHPGFYMRKNDPLGVFSGHQCTVCKKVGQVYGTDVYSYNADHINAPEPDTTHDKNARYVFEGIARNALTSEKRLNSFTHDVIQNPGAPWEPKLANFARPSRDRAKARTMRPQLSNRERLTIQHMRSMLSSQWKPIVPNLEYGQRRQGELPIDWIVADPPRISMRLNATFIKICVAEADYTLNDDNITRILRNPPPVLTSPWSSTTTPVPQTSASSSTQPIVTDTGPGVAATPVARLDDTLESCTTQMTLTAALDTVTDAMQDLAHYRNTAATPQPSTQFYGGYQSSSSHPIKIDDTQHVVAQRQLVAVILAIATLTHPHNELHEPIYNEQVFPSSGDHVLPRDRLRPIIPERYNNKVTVDCPVTKTLMELLFC